MELRHAGGGGTGAAGIAARLVTSVLRVPLLVKVLGANLLIVGAALAQEYAWPGASPLLRTLGVLTASFVATALLVWLALRPIAQLESTAERVSDGDFAARTPLSPVADRAVDHLASTMNRLLDRVEADRTRIQYLAGRSVRARDIERESVARELRESLAQMVAGIALQIAAMRRHPLEPEAVRELEATSLLVEDLTDQIRGVAETLYPGTIGEFGLGNALRALARVAARRSDVHVDVEAAELSSPLPSASASALYRVAEEALRNVNQHSQASRAKVTLAESDDSITLEITDNGRGVDVLTQDPLQAGLGLFSARAVLALVGGELQLSGAPGRGTQVRARIPYKSTGKGPWLPTS